jgi:acyl dehydratase
MASDVVLGWEDFPVGREMTTSKVTVTETHVVEFANLTGDGYPLHTDALFAARSPFGQRVAHGALTFALAVGLMYQSRVYGDAIIAWLGADQFQAKAPVFIGDTVHVVATVTGARPTKDGARGVVDLEYAVRNQRGEDVMSLALTMLMRARQAAA